VSPVRKPLRTLLLEDDPFQVMLVEVELTQHLGNEVELTQVPSLAEAVELLERETFDVALVDLNLVDTRGPQILERLRAAAPAMPLVVLTGYDDDAVRQACFAAGATAVLDKQKAYSHSIMAALNEAVGA
jgi:CheY-like chemotaxis protein